MAHLRRRLPSQHHVEFRTAENKHIVLVDEHDLDSIAQGVRKNRRQLKAAESGPEHHDSRFHVLLLLLNIAQYTDTKTSSVISSAARLSARGQFCEVEKPASRLRPKAEPALSEVEGFLDCVPPSDERMAELRLR